MAWIESHDDIWEHHKTVKLCALLNISDVEAVGHLMSLWHFVLRNAWHDANLEPWGDLGVEHAAKWRGEPMLFIKAIRSAGYLDGYVVHGWIERAGKLVTDRIYNEERRKNANLRRKTVATLPYPTLPNPTEPTDDKASMAGTGGGNGAESQPDELRDQSKAAHDDYEVIQTVWNDIAHLSLPRCKEIGSGRRRDAMRERWKEHPDIAYWRMTVQNMNAQTFCLGENDRRWMSSMDFLLRPESAIKINEGAYLKPEEARRFKCCGRCRGEGAWVKGRSSDGKIGLCSECLKKESGQEQKEKETTST